MLKLFKRNQLPAPLAVGADPLKIRNLLDDPRLQAVMNTSLTAADASLPEPGQIGRIGRIDRIDRDVVLDNAA